MTRSITAIMLATAMVFSGQAVSNAEPAAQQFDPAVLDATAARLNLTDTQRVAALPVLEAGILERQQILKDAGFERVKKPNLRQLLRVRDPLRASRARTDAELSGILSAEQMLEYREIVEEQRQKIRAGR